MGVLEVLMMVLMMDAVDGSIGVFDEANGAGVSAETWIANLFVYVIEIV